MLLKVRCPCCNKKLIAPFNAPEHFVLKCESCFRRFLLSEVPEEKREYYSVSLTEKCSNCGDSATPNFLKTHDNLCHQCYWSKQNDARTKTAIRDDAADNKGEDTTAANLVIRCLKQSCDKKIRVPIDKMDKMGTCPGCGQHFRINKEFKPVIAYGLPRKQSQRQNIVKQKRIRSKAIRDDSIQAQSTKTIDTMEGDMSKKLRFEESRMPVEDTIDKALLDEFNHLIMQTGKDIGKEIIFPVIKTEFNGLMEQVRIILDQIKCGEIAEMQKPITERLENILKGHCSFDAKIDQLLSSWQKSGETINKEVAYLQTVLGEMSKMNKSRFDLLTSIIIEKNGTVFNEVKKSIKDADNRESRRNDILKEVFVEIQAKQFLHDRKLHMLFGLVVVLLAYLLTTRYDLWVWAFFGVLAITWLISIDWKGMLGLRRSALFCDKK